MAAPFIKFALRISRSLSTHQQLEIEAYGCATQQIRESDKEGAKQRAGKNHRLERRAITVP